MFSENYNKLCFICYQEDSDLVDCILILIRIKTIKIIQKNYNLIRKLSADHITIKQNLKKTMREISIKVFFLIFHKKIVRVRTTG